MSLESDAGTISHVRSGEGGDVNALGDRLETMLFAMFSGLSAIVVSFLWVALSLQ